MEHVNNFKIYKNRFPNADWQHIYELYNIPEYYRSSLGFTMEDLYKNYYEIHNEHADYQSSKDVLSRLKQRDAFHQDVIIRFFKLLARNRDI